MNAQVWVEALYAGAVYGLVALGFTIVYAPTRVLNFAQGEFFILGAAVVYQLASLQRVAMPVAVGVALLLAVVMGVVQERMIMLPVRRSGSRFAWIIATLAAALIFQALFAIRFSGSTVLRPQPLVSGSFELAGVGLDVQRALLVVTAVVVVLAYDQFLRRSLYGRAIRATAHDAETAVLMGIGVRSVVLASFVISALVCALAGLLAAPVLAIQPASGLLYTVKGFTAAVLGGLGVPRGALVGGLLVGLLDSVLRNLVSTNAGNIASLAVLAAILVVFPAGLFGKPLEGH